MHCFHCQRIPTAKKHHNDEKNSIDANFTKQNKNGCNDIAKLNGSNITHSNTVGCFNLAALKRILHIKLLSPLACKEHAATQLQ